jgi:hypothetical protein
MMNDNDNSSVPDDNTPDAPNSNYDNTLDTRTPDERTIEAASSGAPDPEASPWDSDDAIESLTQERTIYNETNEQLTKRLLEEAAPMAAQSIIHIAVHDPNGNTRLRAAQYIADKVYGDDSEKSGKSGWEQLVGSVVSEAELLTQQSARD